MGIPQDIRKEFPISEGVIHLNSAAMSLIPHSAVDALLKSLKDGETANEQWMKNRVEREDRARQHSAKMINGSQEDVCMIANTSEGINIIAQGLAWKKGDNVVLTDAEFPGNVLPWLNLRKQGVAVTVVRAEYGKDPTERIFAAVNERTKVVSISFVGWIDGFMHDLDEIGRFCRERDIILAVDAIQGLGAMKIDVKSSKISFLAAGGFKWLLSPPGTGIMYIDKELLAHLDQKYVGYLSDRSEAEEFDFTMNLKDDIMRFRIGSINYPGIAAMAKSLELILNVGVENIQKHILELIDYAGKRLLEKSYSVISPLEAKNRSGILTFGGRNILEKYFRLADKGILTSYRKEWLRISPHLFNNKDDIDRLLEEL